MKKLIFVFLFFGIAMFYIGCSDQNPSAPGLNQNDQVVNILDKKPAPNIIGNLVADFTLTPPTVWNGTIDFGTVGKYSITFYSLTPPRDYSQASPFSEDFYIYRLGGDWQNQADVYLKGHHDGVLVYANNPPDSTKFESNGKVVEASGPFEMWQDRIYHIRGFVTWVSVGLPKGGRGTLQIN